MLSLSTNPTQFRLHGAGQCRPSIVVQQPRVAKRCVQAPSNSKTQTAVTVCFTTENVTVEAKSGEFFMDVAARAGVDIPVGCNQGNCGVCEVEVDKVSEDGKASGNSVIRACIAKVPPGYAAIKISQMTDQIWGVDGFDT